VSSPQNNWLDYYKAVDKQPPHTTLTKALDSFAEAGSGRLAIDLGCGSGRDSLELLRRGWRVLAIDREEKGLKLLREKVRQEHYSGLEIHCAAFEDLQTLPECTLVNASFSLPFCAPTHFEKLWQLIVTAIKPGGRFVGTFFGTKDSWAQPEKQQLKTFHSREQLEKLLEAFEIEDLLEQEYDGQTALGSSKHWHIFEVIATKNN
jgi:tellurite methyltransferase